MGFEKFIWYMLGLALGVVCFLIFKHFWNKRNTEQFPEVKSTCNLPESSRLNELRFQSGIMASSMIDTMQSIQLEVRSFAFPNCPNLLYILNYSSLGFKEELGNIPNFFTKGISVESYKQMSDQEHRLLFDAFDTYKSIRDDIKFLHSDAVSMLSIIDRTSEVSVIDKSLQPIAELMKSISKRISYIREKCEILFEGLLEKRWKIARVDSKNIYQRFADVIPKIEDHWILEEAKQLNCRIAKYLSSDIRNSDSQRWLEHYYLPTTVLLLEDFVDREFGSDKLIPLCSESISVVNNVLDGWLESLNRSSVDSLEIEVRAMVNMAKMRGDFSENKLTVKES